MKKVVAIVLRDNDKILVQLRDNIPSIPYPNHWTVPSGSIEQNESPIEAIKRECKEETGYSLKNPKLTYTGYQVENNNEKVKTYFFTEDYDKKQKINCFEGQKMKFKTEEEISKLNVVEIVRKALKI